MLKKATSFIMIALLFLSVNSSYSRDDIKRQKIALDGSEIGQPNAKVSHITTDDSYPSVTTSFGRATFVPFGAASFYDLQSNGSPAQVWQDPLTPANVHCVFMNQSPFSGTRQVIYYFSNDRGATWGLVGNVTESRGGFPAIRGLNTGAAAVALHTDAGGGTTRTQLFIDVGPGFGAFARCDPGGIGTSFGIWPRLTVTSTNRTVFISSVSGSAITATNTMTPPCNLTGYVEFPSDQAEAYTLAVAQNGTIGNAYIVDDAVDQGSVRYRESNDNGVTWVNEITIFQGTQADSTGCLRGVDMTFIGNVPFVTFSIDRILGTGFFPTLPSKIAVWSPTVNGGVYKIVASEANVPYFPNTGLQDGVFTPLCRPVIGRSLTGNALFLAMNAATGVAAADSNRYFATYFTYSANAGVTWSVPERITPAAPLKDWRYVSISPTSPQVGQLWQVQMVCENHNYAGAFSPNEPPGPSDFVGIVMDVIVGINTISNVVPGDFSLAQNYPNPFNPTTSIRFDIKKSGNVSLKVYNTNGIEVATLVDNEVLSPGTKEISFDGANLNSGAYFYTLSAGDYKETKKMMLIK